jgi:hypothetical protein
VFTRLFTRLFKRLGRPKELVDEFFLGEIVGHGKKEAKTVVVLFAGMELVIQRRVLWRRD